MSSTLYTDKVSSREGTKVINLNGVNIVADNVQTNSVLRATSSTEARWMSLPVTPAPTTSEYILLNSNASLPNARVLSLGSGLSGVDNGANNTYEIDTTSPTTITGRFYNPTLTVDAQGRVVNATNGQSIVFPAKVASTQNGLLDTDFEEGASIDGFILTTGDRILIKDQTNGVENGYYVVNTTGAPTRDRDFENLLGSSSPIQGLIISIKNGVNNGGASFLCTNKVPTVIGTDPIEFRNLAGFINRIKVLDPREIGTYYDLATTVKGVNNQYLHLDLQTAQNLDGGATVGSSGKGVSIDGKMSPITLPNASDVLTFNGIGQLSIKNLNLTKSASGTSPCLALTGCSKVLISGCIFRGIANPSLLSLSACSNVIVKNCVFISTGGTSANVISSTGSTRVSYFNNQFRDFEIGDNSVHACLNSTDNQLLTSFNSFTGCGRAMATGDAVSTYNCIYDISSNTTGSVSRNLGTNIKFGYLEAFTSAQVLSNNNVGYFGNGLMTTNNYFCGILLRESADSSVILGNNFNTFTSSLTNNISDKSANIGLESQCSHTTLMDNSSGNSVVSSGFVMAPSFVIVGDDCNQGYIGYCQAYNYLTQSLLNTYELTQCGYHLSSTGNDLIKIKRGNTALVFSKLSQNHPFNDPIDYYEFDTNSSATTTTPFSGGLNWNSAGYRMVFRRNTALSGGGGIIDINFSPSSLITGTATKMRFPSGSPSYIILEWNGSAYSLLEAGGGASLM